MQRFGKQEVWHLGLQSLQKVGFKSLAEATLQETALDLHRGSTLHKYVSPAVKMLECAAGLQHQHETCSPCDVHIQPLAKSPKLVQSSVQYIATRTSCAVIYST